MHSPLKLVTWYTCVYYIAVISFFVGERYFLKIYSNLMIIESESYVCQYNNAWLIPIIKTTLGDKSGLNSDFIFIARAN